MPQEQGHGTRRHATDQEESIPASCRLSSYDYELPTELIAQEPTSHRDQSRLMVIHRKTGEIGHYVFRDLPGLLSPSDLLVINETRVAPAALRGRKESGGRVELLVLDPGQTAHEAASATSTVRTCLVRSSKPLRKGTVFLVDGGPALTVEETVSAGRVKIRFPVREQDFPAWLDEFGLPPLPPYIKSENRDVQRDKSRYQTVYATTFGSVAAPTAGLHFTEELLRELANRGIGVARVVLHVGPGTFTPVRNEDIRLHRMEAEFFDIPEQNAQLVNAARIENRSIVAVGTTTVRALESAATQEGLLKAGAGRTELFITPGYPFRVVRGLLTNFHLPCSTLIMLVCAFAGRDLVLRAYANAVAEKYRFYSYGDACLIVD